MMSFTQLVGSTDANAYPGSFTNLTQNGSTANVNLGKLLVNQMHRFYLEKYFDNERTYTTVTIGAESDMALSASLVTGATSATLNTAWPNITCQQLVVFSNSEQRTVRFTQGSTAISWDTGLTSAADDEIDTVGVQFYPIPANVSKIKNDTITVGQLVYSPAPVQTIGEWTRLNALPYTSDIPAYYYIYNNQVGFWPIPSTSGNIISFNYQARVADMTYTDYSTGTISAATVGGNTLTGSSTVWTAYPQNVDMSYVNLKIKIDPPDGDGLWYPIQRFTSATALTLNLPLVNVNELTSATYVIGQFPLLHEDFHPLLVYSALCVYFTSIVKDKEKFEMFNALKNQLEQLMESYLGTKSLESVDLGQRPISANPNLFIYAPGS